MKFIDYFIGYKSDFNNLLVIYQAIHVFKPELRHFLPPKELIESILNKAIYPIENENMIEVLLEKGIGGKQYIKNNLMSKIGHHIGNAKIFPKLFTFVLIKIIFLAHAVLYRKGGFPVAFSAENDKVQYVEDINLQAEQQLYAKFLDQFVIL